MMFVAIHIIIKGPNHHIGVDEKRFQLHSSKSLMKLPGKQDMQHRE
jgi:hypothetical protein